MGKGNISNLIQNTDTTPEWRRENASKAGKAGAIAKRRKKEMQSLMQDILQMKTRPGKVDVIRTLKDLPNSNLTAEQRVLFAQLKKAISGDTQAAIFCRDTSGNKPDEVVHVLNEYKIALERCQVLIVDFVAIVEAHVTNPAERLAIGRELEKRREQILDAVSQSEIN